MASKKNTMVRKDPNKKTNINRKLFGALEGVVVKGLEPVSIPFLQQKSLDKPINFGKGFDYVYGTKPVSDQEDKNPFASALKKIKPSTSESKELSWFKSAVVEAKNVNELHKTIDQALAAGARLNACNDGEWSFAEYMILGTHFHKLDKGNRKKIIES